ncbi:MAG TPA: FAD:protein FMN transferase [Candidatus Desulfobacillus sp.]|nr:FAD:protein FMN transferase [Candidatus Desulfobacillus sp.]
MPKTSSEPAARSAGTTLHGLTMATRWSVTLGDAPMQASEKTSLHAALAACVQQIDAQMSPWKQDSDLSRLNRAAVNAWVDLPAEMLAVLARALEIARQSAGAFDPTVGALVEAWGFGATRNRPDPAAIRAARAVDQAANYACLELDLDAGRARKHAAVSIDLCGIAKGYAVDRMAAVVSRHGVRNALVALDGELRAIGVHGGGRPWAVAVESPEPDRRAVHGVVELQDQAIATSGDYRRFWHAGNARIAHSMDRRQAAPVNNPVASVTVLAAECMDADAWATALLVAGPGEGLALARRHGLDALFLIRRDRRWVELGLRRFGPAATAPEPA